MANFSDTKFLLFAGLLSCLVTLGSSIVCHQCQTMANKECNDKFDETNEDFLGDCGDDQVCIKYKTIVKIRDSGYINGWERHSLVVTRSCEQNKGKTDTCVGWQNNGGVTLKCYCSTDNCNSGHNLVPSRTAVLVSCLAPLILFLLYRQQ